MKVGIITITDNNNYGNRLQNYAVEKVLNSLGVEARTIWKKEYNTYKFKIKKAIKGFINSNKYPTLQRAKNFSKFTNYYTNVYYHDYDNKLNEIFDTYVIGSDQIFTESHLDKMEFLLNNNKKVIALAPSFGKNFLKKNEEEFFFKLIPKISYISTREDAGKKIINKLFNNLNVEVLVDPTMLIESDEWEKIMKKPKWMNENKKFILNYFLGELSDERKKTIQNLAKENNCEIINILDKKSKYYNCGPSEFLYLEKHASFICTDSFHSSVFAILFKRPFFIFSRKQVNIQNMNSRLETLIKKFQITNRFVDDVIDVENKIDYSNTDKILKEEREKFLKFLKKSLNS